MNNCTPKYWRTWNGKIPRRYQITKTDSELAENLNRLTTCPETESVMKTSQRREGQDSDNFPGKFYQTIKEELTLILSNSPQKIKKEYIFKYTHEASTGLIPKPNSPQEKKAAVQYPWESRFKTLNKTLANQIQQHVKGILPCANWDDSQECKDGSTHENK